MGKVFVAACALHLARRTLMWALQRVLGNWNSQESPVLLRWCIKQPRVVCRMQTIDPRTSRWSQTHIRHPGNIGKIANEESGHSQIDSLSIQGIPVHGAQLFSASIWYLDGTSQTSCVQTTGKASTKMQIPGSHLMDSLILLIRGRDCESVF